MKLTEEINSINQSQESEFGIDFLVSSREGICQELICDQEILKDQIKQKYKNHLHSINSLQKQKQSLSQIIKYIGTIICVFFQQLWIQIIPQSIRGRFLGQKDDSIMESFPQLNCGNMNAFLRKMKKEGKHFFIVLEQRITDDECFEIEQNLFENTEQSNQKLKYILQCETISLNRNDLMHLKKQNNLYAKLACLITKQKRVPILLVCRYNYLEELKVMGEIELSQLSKQSFVQVFEEIKRYIMDLRNLQSECKRQVLSQFLLSNR